MRIKTIAMAAALCCLGLTISAGAASAQMGGMGMARNIPGFGGIFNPTVGLGADYDMTTSKGENMKMSMAIVGKDTINGQPGYWMQLTINSPKTQGPMYMKMLSVKTGDQVMTSRMIMGINGQAYQMPDQMVNMNQKPRDANIATSNDVVGTESITVPAGTFSTTHYRSKDGASDFWIANDAGPWGMVKMQSKDGTTMVLTKTYTDAKDMLPGPAQPFPGMGQR
jgi:hypothetical protein